MKSPGIYMQREGGDAMIDMDSIYNEHAKLVYKFLLSLCHEPDTAEELTQETFYQAVRCSDRYNGECKVSTWLCQIAKNLWHKELRNRRRKNSLPLSEDILSNAPGIEEQIFLKEEKMDMFRKIHALNETSKEVLLLRITGEFSFKEIGELFGKSDNWARVTFYRAKQKIMEG